VGVIPAFWWPNLKGFPVKYYIKKIKNFGSPDLKKNKKKKTGNPA
jgi:hypothetical protein